MAAVMSPANQQFSAKDVTLHVTMLFTKFCLQSDVAKLLTASIRNLLVTSKNTHLIQLVVHVIKKNRHAGMESKGCTRGKDKQRKLPFEMMRASCLSCPRVSFALQPAWRFSYTGMTSCKGTIKKVNELRTNKKIIEWGLVLVRNSAISSWHNRERHVFF